VAVQLDTPRLRQNFLETQQYFQQQIVSLDAGDLEPDSQPRVRSYQTEMSKQLRLLGMDMMFFLRAAAADYYKTSTTSDRIQTLITAMQFAIKLKNCNLIQYLKSKPNSCRLVARQAY